MSPEEIREKILSKKGIVGVTFIKKDGTLRRMACIRGCKRGVKGVVDREYEDKRNNLLTVFDMNADRISNSQKGGFRRINLKTVKSINGEHIAPII